MLLSVLLPKIKFIVFRAIDNVGIEHTDYTMVTGLLCTKDSAKLSFQTSANTMFVIFDICVYTTNMNIKIHIFFYLTLLFFFVIVVYCKILSIYRYYCFYIKI